MDCGTRLKQIRELMGYTQAQFGERLGFKWSKIKDIEIGKQRLTHEIAAEIEKRFCISFKWLLTGQGSMSVVDEQAESPVDLLTAQINALLREFSIDEKKKILQSLEEKKEY